MADRVELITYADRLGGDLPGLRNLLVGPLSGLFGGVHVPPIWRREAPAQQLPGRNSLLRRERVAIQHLVASGGVGDRNAELRDFVAIIEDGNAALLQHIEDRFGWSLDDHESWLADMLIFSCYGNDVADGSRSAR